MLKEIYSISRYPQLLSEDGGSFFQKLLRVLKVYGLVFAALFFVGGFLAGLDQFVVHVLHFKAISATNAVNDTLIHKMGWVKAILVICLAAPFFEEVIFRLPLSLKKTFITISFTIVGFVIGGYCVIALKIAHYKIAIDLSVAVVALLLSLWLVSNTLSISTHRFGKYFIIFSMCLFALMHVGNYNTIQWPIVWMYPLYVLPQFFMGWGITYLRFKNGFFWGVLLHAIINSMAVGMSLGLGK